jgi:glycosyltransferase involved in cell wall biosynthesis
MKLENQTNLSTSIIPPQPTIVLHIIDKLSVRGSGTHGITRYFLQSIPRFDPKKFSFIICSLRAPELAGESLGQLGIPVYFLNKGRFDPRTLYSLVKIIKDIKPHILHLHGFGASTFGRIASVLTGLPNIVHEHLIFEKNPVCQSLPDHVLSRFTTKAIAISAPVRQYMIEHRSIEAKKIETFFYGLPLEEFQPPDKHVLHELRSELGISSDEQVVCTIARLDTQKGQIYLLNAAVSILEELPKTRFLIVGDGPDRNMLEKVAKKLGILNRVIFTGYRTDVVDLIGLSDIFVIPSLREGGPLTMFEAMSLRKPVVGTPVGMMPEIIEDGRTGFIVPCCDEFALAKKILLLLKNPELANTIGENGWQVCQEFDISNSIQRLEKIYCELVT